MTPLAIAACALGGSKLVGSLGALYAPDTSRRILLAFPRHDMTGWMLTAINLFWAGWLLLNTPPFSEFVHVEPLVYVGTPVVFFALVIFLDEMLAARAFGGLLLLVASPLLSVARWHPSNLSIVMSLLAYAWVVYGMILVVSPYRFRNTVQFWTRNRGRFRVGSLFGCLAGGALLFLGLTVY